MSTIKSVPKSNSSTSSNSTICYTYYGEKQVSISKFIKNRKEYKTSHTKSWFRPYRRGKNVLAVLSHEREYIDRITKMTKLETATVSSTLSMLEIKGLVKNIGGQQYIKL